MKDSQCLKKMLKALIHNMWNCLMIYRVQNSFVFTMGVCENVDSRVLKLVTSVIARE